MKVYLITIDHSYQDDESRQIFAFKSYKNAFDEFIKIINDEKTFEDGWVKEAFDENSNTLPDYELDEHIESDGTQEYTCWWDLQDIYDWNKRVSIELQIIETSD